MSSAVQKQAADLAWSLWTELGIAGVVREHAHVAIDPEPLFVATPLLAAHDARLLEQVSRWSVLFGDWLAMSRVQALCKAAEPTVHDAFVSFAASIPGGGRWTCEAPKMSKQKNPPQLKSMELPLLRPALVRLRLRAICGVGARADVVAELIGHARVWLRASDFEHLGYTKRNVARLLSELCDAGFLRSLKEKNAIAYRLADGGRWSDLVGATAVTWPAWPAIFDFARLALRLDEERAKGEGVRRVAAAQTAHALEPLCDRLDLAQPPTATANPQAWAATTAFVEREVAAFAGATSPSMSRAGGARGRVSAAR